MKTVQAAIYAMIMLVQFSGTQSNAGNLDSLMNGPERPDTKTGLQGSVGTSVDGIIKRINACDSTGSVTLSGSTLTVYDNREPETSTASISDATLGTLGHDDETEIYFNCRGNNISCWKSGAWRQNPWLTLRPSGRCTTTVLGKLVTDLQAYAGDDGFAPRQTIYSTTEGNSIYVHNSTSRSVRCFTEYSVPNGVGGLDGDTRTVDVPADGQTGVTEGIVYSFRIKSCKPYDPHKLR